MLLRAEEEELCKQELRALQIQVRDEATIGHFTIHLDDPLDWAKVGAVVFGEVFSELGSEMTVSSGGEESYSI